MLSETKISEEYLNNAEEFERQILEILSADQIKIPELKDAYLNCATAYESAGLYQKALENYLELLNLNSDLPDLNLRIASMYEKMGDAENAMKHFQNQMYKNEINDQMQQKSVETNEIATLISSFNSEFASHLKLQPYDQKNQELDEKKLEEFQGLFQKMLEKFPDNYELTFCYGEILRLKKDYQNALHYLGEAARLSQNNPDIRVWLSRGHACCECGFFLQAIKSYEEAEAIDPNDMRVHQNIAFAATKIASKKQAAEYLEQKAKSYADKNDQLKAMIYYQKLFEVIQEKNDTLLDISFLNLTGNKLETAKELAEKAFANNNKDVNALLIMAQINRLQGNLEEANKFHDLIEQFELQTKETIYEKALLLIAEEKHEEALALLSKEAPTHKDYFPFYMLMGYLYIQFGEINEVEGIRCYDYVIQNSNDYTERAQAFFEKGLYYQEKKDFATALDCFKSAVTHDVAFADAYNYMGEIELKNKNYPAALQHFNSAHELEPKNEKYLDNIARVTALNSQDIDTDLAASITDQIQTSVAPKQSTLPTQSLVRILNRSESPFRRGLQSTDNQENENNNNNNADNYLTTMMSNMNMK